MVTPELKDLLEQRRQLTPTRGVTNETRELLEQRRQSTPSPQPNASLLRRLGGRIKDTILDVPLPGGIGTPRKLLEGSRAFERQIIEPVTAAGTVVQAPSALGIAGVPGFQGEFAFNPEQLPGREGFREEFRSNVPVGSRILAEAAFDPLNVIPGVGFTKVPRRLARAPSVGAKAFSAEAVARRAPRPTGPLELPPSVRPEQVPRPALPIPAQEAAGPTAALRQQILEADDALTRAINAEDDLAILAADGERNRLTSQVDSNAVPEDVVARLRVEAAPAAGDLTRITPPPEQVGRQSVPGGPVSPNAPAGAEIPPPPRAAPPAKLGDPTNFTTQLEVTFNPNAARRVGETLARTPVVGSILRWANPTLAEASNVGKAGLTRAALIDEGRNRVSAFTASQRQHGLQDELFGATDEATGLLTSGPLKGTSVQDIAENPSRFALSAQQRKWIDSGDALEKELLSFYTRNGIPINQVPLDEIERYAGRIHVAQITPDGEIISQGSVGRGRNLGGKTSAEKARVFTTVKEAQDAGYVPLSYQESLRARSQSAYNRVVNKQAQEWLEANPGAGVTIRAARIGEQGTFGTFRDLNFPGKVVEGPGAGQFTAEIDNLIRPQAVNTALKGIDAVNSVQRIFALAGDASPFAIQLIASMFRHPLITARAGVEFNQTLFRAMFNPRAARARRARRITEQNDILQDFPGIIMSDTGLEATQALGKGGLLNNAVVGKPAALLRPFQQAFEATMDEAGTHLAIALRPLARGNPQRLRDITDYINSMRGLTSSARIGLSPNQRLVEGSILLAPRYRRAVASLHASVLQGELRGSLARRAYLHLAVGLVTSFAGLTISLGLMQGKSESVIKDDLRQGLDPRNRRFMLWNLGGQAVGPGSKFISDIRMLGKIATDPNAIADLSAGQFNVGFRWVRSQLAAVPSNAWDLFSGKNYLGEPITNDFSGNPLDSLKSLGDLVKEDLMPLWLSSVLFEGGTPEERATRGTAEFAGLRAYDFPDRTLDEVIKELYGDAEDFDTLPRRALNRAIKLWEAQLSEKRQGKREETKTRKKEDEDRIEREFFERQSERDTR